MQTFLFIKIYQVRAKEPVAVKSAAGCMLTGKYKHCNVQYLSMSCSKNSNNLVVNEPNDTLPPQIKRFWETDGYDS